MKIEIIGGKNEIGGNCIRIVDKDEIVIFDQGIRFSVFKRYYSKTVEPSGPGELRAFGVIPSKHVFEGVRELYITHFHLDHLGILFDVPQSIRIHVPSISYLELIKRRYSKSPTWLSYIPPRSMDNISEPTLFKGDKVIGLLARHSNYPSLAYLYFGSDKTILYTGDFRIERIPPKPIDENLYPQTFLDYLEENNDSKIDTLIIEGTNIGKTFTYLDGNTTLKLIEKIVSPKKPAMFITDPSDIELLILITIIANQTNKKIVIASDRLTQLAEQYINKIEVVDPETIEILDITTEEITIFDITTETEIQTNPTEYAIITDTTNISTVLRHLGNHIPQNSPAFLMTAEPHDESSTHTEKVILNWLEKYGLITYRYRISGHYYPHQLEQIIKKIKPKTIIPIHTQKPEKLLKLSTYR